MKKIVILLILSILLGACSNVTPTPTIETVEPQAVIVTVIVEQIITATPKNTPSSTATLAITATPVKCLPWQADANNICEDPIYSYGAMCWSYPSYPETQCRGTCPKWGSWITIGVHGEGDYLPWNTPIKEFRVSWNNLLQERECIK